MKRLVMGLVLLTAAAGLVYADGEKNAWGSFKVGSWVKTKMKSVSETPQGKMETIVETKTTLKELTADEATIEMESETTMIMNGTENKVPKQPPQTAKIPLKQAAVQQPDDKGPKPDQGEEEITVAGKKLKCKWTKMTVDAGGMKSTTKVWTSEEIPGFAARTESKTEGAAKSEMVTEVIGYEVAK